MWHIISWIIFGLIVGALAKFLMPGPNDPRGCLVTIALGICGSLVGGFIGRGLGFYGPEVSAAGFLMSLLGAVLILVLYRALQGRRA